MATITNQTNALLFESGTGKLAIPKDKIIQVKKKASTILIFREGDAPITVVPAEITSPAFVDLDDLYDTIVGYL